MSYSVIKIIDNDDGVYKSVLLDGVAIYTCLWFGESDEDFINNAVRKLG